LYWACSDTGASMANAIKTAKNVLNLRKNVMFRYGVLGNTFLIGRDWYRSIMGVVSQTTKSARSILYSAAENANPPQTAVNPCFDGQRIQRYARENGTNTALRRLIYNTLHSVTANGTALEVKGSPGGTRK
jgi:hypothetical protein